MIIARLNPLVLFVASFALLSSYWFVVQAHLWAIGAVFAFLGIRTGLLGLRVMAMSLGFGVR